jgi:LacI family transcriptional regulator
LVKSLSFLELMRTTRRILLAFHLPEALRDLLDGISSYVRVASCHWQVECVEPRDFYTAFGGHLADGAITALGPRSRGTLQRLRASHVPVVNVLRNVQPYLPSVLSDNSAIGRAGAEYLLGRGFRQFAFVGVDTPWSRDRQAGFAATLRAAGVPALVTPSGLRLADFEYGSKVRASRLLRPWVRNLPRGTGAMAAADFIARYFLAACEEERIPVPEHVAMLGVDNFHAVCELAPVPLSSVAQNFVLMGREAAALLDGLMSGRRPIPSPVRLLPPGRIHVRKSTDILVFEDPLVVSAVRIIHAHAGSGITMKDLLRQIPLSRKWLDHRFKRLVGRTPSQEIRACRLQYVRDLLTDTDMPLRQIATRCRFSCEQNLVRAFRVAYGLSPEAFRRRNRNCAPDPATGDAR